VHGTVGGTAVFTTPSGKTTVANHWTPDNIGHTFTMRSAPGVDSNFFLTCRCRPTEPADRLVERRRRPALHGDVQFHLGIEGRLRLELRVPLRIDGGQLRGVMGAYGTCRGSSMSF